VSQTSISQEGNVRPLPLGNRRALIRYRCAPAMMGKIFANGDQELQRAWIIDLSQRGIGMQISRPLQSGDHIVIAMRSNTGAKVYELTALVAHCRELYHGEFLIGCELAIALSSDELDDLL
jgi:hypothetical protein